MPIGNGKISPIKMLYLHHLESITFSESLGNLDSLEVLYINRVKNKIKIPKYFSKLKKLLGIKMIYCSMDKIPVVSNSLKLEEFVISSCTFDQNTLSIARNKNLCNLVLVNPNNIFDAVEEYQPLGLLNFEQMENFPKKLENLTSLKSLTFGSKKIKTIPTFFTKLTSLENFCIPLSKIDFDGVKRLYELPNLTTCYYQTVKDITEEQQNELDFLSNKRERPLNTRSCEYHSTFVWEPAYDKKYNH